MLYIKMICKPDGTIVGCQMLSEGDLSSRIDVLSFIITDNMNCEELIQKEFSTCCHAPFRQEQQAGRPECQPENPVLRPGGQAVQHTIENGRKRERKHTIRL